jgi:hypothetical protein
MVNTILLASELLRKFASISPLQNPKRAELVLNLARSRARIQIPHVDASHSGRSSPARREKENKNRTKWSRF